MVIGALGGLQDRLKRGTVCLPLEYAWSTSKFQSLKHSWVGMKLTDISQSPQPLLHPTWYLGNPLCALLLLIKKNRLRHIYQWPLQRAALGIRQNNKGKFLLQVQGSTSSHFLNPPETTPRTKRLWVIITPSQTQRKKKNYKRPDGLSPLTAPNANAASGSVAAAKPHRGPH